MTLDTYGHVFDELEDAETGTAEELIRKARTKNRPRLSRVRPGSQGVSQTANKNPAERGSWRADARIRTADPFITSTDQLSPPVVPGRRKPHESEQFAPLRWRPKTGSDNPVDPA
jgi:hypothetical protein